MRLHSLSPAGFARRGACAALSILVLVSSLTCMTVACRVVCAAEQRASAPSAVASDVPPCHRAPGGPGAGAEGRSGATPAPDGCGSGPVCCSTWLHDDESIHLADPKLLREHVPGGEPGLAPLPGEAGDPEASSATTVERDAPRPLPSPHLASRASRAPPAARPAA